MGVTGNGTVDTAARKYKTLKSFNWTTDGDVNGVEYILERTVVEFYIFYVHNSTNTNITDFTINVDSITSTGGFGIDQGPLYSAYGIIVGIFTAWLLCATGSFLIWFFGFKPRFEKKYGINKDMERSETLENMHDDDNYKTGDIGMDTKVPLPKKHQDTFSPLDISTTTLGGLNQSKLNSSMGPYEGDHLAETK